MWGEKTCVSLRLCNGVEQWESMGKCIKQRTKRTLVAFLLHTILTILSWKISLDLAFFWEIFCHFTKDVLHHFTIFLCRSKTTKMFCSKKYFEFFGDFGQKKGLKNIWQQQCIWLDNILSSRWIGGSETVSLSALAVTLKGKPIKDGGYGWRLPNVAISRENQFRKTLFWRL